MNRIQEIDKLVTELYSKLHEAVNYYVDLCEAMMTPTKPYVAIDEIVEKIAALKVERAYWEAKHS